MITISLHTKILILMPDPYNRYHFFGKYPMMTIFLACILIQAQGHKCGRGAAHACDVRMQFTLQVEFCTLHRFQMHTCKFQNPPEYLIIRFMVPWTLGVQLVPVNLPSRNHHRSAPLSCRLSPYIS